MSSPENQLSQFRTYSYYHVLAMCDCSETADALALDTSLDTWYHATPSTITQDDRVNTTALGPYAPKRLQNNPNMGKYCILINGSTDAAYVIDSATWSSSTGADAAPGSRSTSIAIEGSIHVSEPKGVAFLDQIVQCSIALGVDSATVVYVLKTFFVGIQHDDYGNDTPVHISDVPPINFIMYEATGSFTEQGGLYEMQFVAAGHGAARLSQYGKAVNAMSITAGASLEQTLTNLQTQINENYDRYYKCVIDQIQAMNGDTTALVKSLNKVKYVIKVGSDYMDANDGQIKYTVTNQAQQFKNTAGCGDAAQAHFPAQSSIEGAISTIMQMSPQVQADAGQGGATDGIKYEFKIHTAVETKRVQGSSSDDLECTVYYRVDRIVSPKSIASNPAFATLASDADINDPAYALIRNNIITFDYMYTGKNIDILELDMKLNMGLAYLQTATLANTFKSQLERAPNRTMQPSTSDTNNAGVRFGGAQVQSFIFFGSQIKTPNLMNTQNAGNSIQSMYTMNKHASLEVTEASMKITGNSQLLGDVNKTTSAGYVTGYTSNDASTTIVNSSASFQNWSHVPAYVKVNIKMPRENDDFALFTGSSTTGDPSAPGATDYARPFWFDGYYYVYGIEHNFDSGVFTQELKMIGIPKKSSLAATASTANNKEVNITTAVGSCYDNQIGCSSGQQTPTGSGSTGSVAVPHTPPAATTAPTNTADAVSTQQNSAGLTNVVGWNEAAADVKAAIQDAANRYSVDVVTLAQICCHESGFKPNAQNPKTTAQGLFQFVDQTWIGLIKQGQVIGLTDTSLANKFVPKWASYAGAAYLKQNQAIVGSLDVGDVYMAHFAGPGVAKAIIANCNATGGSTLAVTVIDKPTGVAPAGTFAAYVKANSPYIHNGMSAAEFRAFSIRVMSATLITNTPVAGHKSQAVAATVAPPVTTNINTTSEARRDAATALSSAQNCAAQAAAAKNASACGPTAQTAPSNTPATGTPQAGV